MTEYELAGCAAVDCDDAVLLGSRNVFLLLFARIVRYEGPGRRWRLIEK